MNDEETSFHATRDVFHKLQLILPKVLKNDGELDSREIWHGENIENETVLKQIANMNDRATSISLARLRLKRAEELLDIFSFLKSSLENQISSFRARVPKRCITDLPNELLLLIFDYSEPDQLCLRGLLHVCKRFRYLVLSSPCLWARQTLGLHSSSYEINTIAKRSGKLGIRVSFDDEDDFDGTFRPLAKYEIFRHSKSWISLELRRLSNFDLQQFQTCAPCTNLTFLKELIIEPCFDEGPVWQFSRDWFLPYLKSLKCVNCVPQLLRASTLSVCSITFRNIFPLSDVTAFLSSAISIERLSIALLTIHSGSEGVAMVTLPNLKNLAVHLLDTDDSIVTNTFRTIMSPNITSFLAIVGVLGDWPDPSWGLRLLTKGLNVRYPLLKKVGLGAIGGKFGEVETIYNHHDVSATLDNLPRGVEDLVLLIRNQDCDIHIPSDAVDTLEGLRSLGFAHCNRLNEEFFHQLPILLKKYGIRLDNIQLENSEFCCFYDTHPGDFMREKDVKGSLIREGVTKKVLVGEYRSAMMEEILASHDDFFEYY